MPPTETDNTEPIYPPGSTDNAWKAALGMEGREVRWYPTLHPVHLQPFAGIAHQTYRVQVTVLDPDWNVVRETEYLELSRAQVQGLTVSFPPLEAPTEQSYSAEAPSPAPTRTEEEWVRIDIP